ncbi:hypothetical protein MKW94_030130 [Papaver nudicaule]|uniref:Uncharacterized protein n=1 Tax=Papaver nudicaule TaxID=74823 RepID=A0AA41VIE7_PAPNU|nr:hypothetical protein [Papaver nudicaule]
MEPMNSSTNTLSSTTIDISDEPNTKILPLLLNPSYLRTKSNIYDELRNFRVSLRWCALDHSTNVNKTVSYLVFILLTIVVPILTSVFVHVPKTSTIEDPISFNKLIQLPESGLAIIGFFTISRFFEKYGLRRLLFLDQLQDDSTYVRRGYVRELDRSFRHLAYILLPSFLVELAHKILFFSTVIVSIPVPYVENRLPYNSIMFLAGLVSWVYRTGVFLLVCALFRLTCELQILRFEGFQKMLEGYGSDPGAIFEEHMRIKKQLSETSHRYRFFIVASLFMITICQFGVLILVLGSKAEKNFFNSGDLVVCSAVQLSGFLLSILGAARITHRAQGIASVATRWHMLHATAACNGIPESTNSSALEKKGRNPEADGGVVEETKRMISSSSRNGTLTAMPSHDSSSFQTRQALVTYLQHNNGGITVYGFALDRGLLHTLFAFEFSLVLWILSKVVVLST